MKTLRTTTLCLAIVPLAMIGLAFWVQKAWDWSPCTMCVEIRFMLSCVSLLALVALFMPGKWRLFPWGAACVVCAMSVVANAKLVLLEQGILQSFSCSPFPFYSRVLPLQDWLPDLFMSGGVCGENDHIVLGLSFTLWTLSGIFLLLVAMLKHGWSLSRA